MTFNEAADENTVGTPGVQKEVIVHMRRQAVRIRQGNQEDDVTALLTTEVSCERTAPPAEDPVA
jgi:hypothetical protein